MRKGVDMKKLFSIAIIEEASACQRPLFNQG